MKKEDIEKLIRERPSQMRSPQAAQPQTPTPPGGAKTPPPFLGRVNVTYGASEEADYIATLQLLQNCIEDDIFNCTWCDFTTPDPAIMIEHLGYEINKNLDTIRQMYKNPPKHLREQSTPTDHPPPPGR